MSCKRIRSGDQAAARRCRMAAEGRRRRRHPRGRTSPTGLELASPDAQREIEARVQAAYQQGQAAGEAAASQRAALRIEPAVAALNTLIQELAGVRKRFRAEAEEDTVKLAIAIGAARAASRAGHRS